MKTKTYALFMLILLVTYLEFSCKKAERSPCEGLLNESQPKQIGFVFINKQTGENIIIANKLDTAVIKIRSANIVKSYPKMIINNDRNPLNGTLILIIPETGEGDYPFSIDVANFGRVELSYSINQIKSNDICKPYYYSMSSIEVKSHPFEYFENEHILGRKNLLKILL